MHSVPVCVCRPLYVFVCIVSERRMFYAIQTARVIFMAKTSLEVFSLSREQLRLFQSLGDRICGMKCLLVAVGLNACFILLPHWDNMS